MRSVEDLNSLLHAYNPKSDTDLITRAYVYGRDMHEGQYRRSGEPYFMHPVEVAAILAEQRMDDATIVTALLHDTVEDTQATYQEVADFFGNDIAELVDGVTKLTNLQLSSTESKQAENFRKLFVAMSRDLRVILVKLADRLHNMRTINAMSPEKQAQKARETMDIYAPLAGRMGMQWMREELEDLSFQVLNPEARKSIMRRFLVLQKEADDVIEQITADVEAELSRESIHATVTGRAKRPHSIWRKMEEKDLTFSRLSDIYGFRIIADNEQDCYRALGAIHHRWRAVPGRFKDYISQPKSNGYRSIHTTVLGRDGKRVEVQIRTKEMHEVAESGVAAHWSYRDGVRTSNRFAVDPARWVETLSERFENSENHDEFLEHVKLEMYSDKVFCFSPKGEVIKLPKGATPLDFAYAIHTRIGDSCVGAKIDGLRVPLWTRIRNGQSVEIVRAEGQRPQATWLDIVVTGRAKAAIRKSLREEDLERFIKFGRELARVAFDHAGKKATDRTLQAAARVLGIKDADELLARLGASEISAQDVVVAVYPELKTEGIEGIDKARAVVGLPQDQSFARARCCQPLPPERIIGITYRGQGVVVHSIDCENLTQYENQPERWVDLHWHAGQHQAVHDVYLNVVISNDAGVLGRICTLIGEHANISDLKFLDRKPDFYRLLVEIEVRDAEHLNSVLVALEAEMDVASVERSRDPKRHMAQQYKHE
ncbi:MAG: RelA/SpoT family protein [Halocynthiibacter sp.]